MAVGDTLAVLSKLHEGLTIRNAEDLARQGEVVTKRSTSGREKLFIAIRKRYAAPQLPLLPVEQLLPCLRTVRSVARAQLLLPYLLLSDRAAFDVVTQLVLPAITASEQVLEKTSIAELVQQLRVRHGMPRWSDGLALRWASGLRSVLREVGLLGRVIVPYAPDEEVSCINMRELPETLTRQGLRSRPFPVCVEVAAALSRTGDAARPLRTDFERATFESDLADLREGLATIVAHRLAEKIDTDLRSSGVALLCRVGALHPFVHVSTFLQKLTTSGAQCTLAVAYPGTAKGTELRFLGLRDPTGAYRGHIVT